VFRLWRVIEYDEEGEEVKAKKLVATKTLPSKFSLTVLDFR
jgi:hypothetical protein